MSLTACLKKAGTSINPEDKARVLELARQYRQQGLSPDEAAIKAVDEQLLALQAKLDAAQDTLAAPTRGDVLAQQERAANADALDQREQVRKESEAGAGLFSLTMQDGRQDTTGSLFDQAAETNQGKASATPVAESQAPAPEAGEGAAARTRAGAGPVITDFGEKLPPARRAMAARLDESLSDEKIATLPFSQVWPAAENDAIEDTFAAAVAHTARAEVPAKPRVAYKVKGWVEKVKTVRDLASMVVSGKVSREKFMERSREYALKNFIAKVKLLEQLDRADWKRVGDVSEAPDAIQYGPNGTRIAKPMVSVTIDDKHHWIEGSGDILQHVDAIKAMLGKEAPEARMQFEIRQEHSGSRKVFINKKGDKSYRELMEFATVEEARAAIKDRYADLVAAWEGVKDRDNITERDLRTAENRPRAGKDHRGGKDVTAEEFQEKFGFRGGEFGKWVSQGAGKQERQFFLNSAYDALMDLSDLLGIPPRAISLEGSLGLAFGSRGGGWASAHFEPSNLVINLTKPRGAGALAHEWFHALDNYFARKRGGEVPFTGNQDQYRRDNYVTYKTKPMMVRKDGRGTPVTKERLEEWRKGSPGQGYLAEDQWIEDPKHKPGVRAEVEQRFYDLVQALNASPMLKRSRVLDGVKEAEGYWSQVIERAARSFENYVQTRMMEQGYHNDFLANVKAAVDVGKNRDRYPYLLPDEIAPIAEAFDNLFQTIKTKETDKGVAMYARGGVPDLLPVDEETEALVQQYGQPVESKIDAERRHAAGERIFAMHEQDDSLSEITSVRQLKNWAPDQLVAVHRAVFEGDESLARGMDAAAFRRAFGAPEPMGVDRTQQIVDELTRTWENGPAFEIVATATDMPGGRHPSDARGLILNGTAYIVAANNPTRDAVARTLGHEAIGHYGLWKMLGEDGTKQFQRNLQLALASGNKSLGRIRDKVRRLYVDDAGKFNLTPEQEANEIAAFAVEEGIDTVTGEFRPGFGFLKSVWAKIAAFLRDTLGLPVRFTNAELQGLLVQSMRGLQVGQRLEGGADMMVAAARDESPEGKALQALSQNDDLFALPKSDKTTVEEIAAEQNPRIKVRKTKIGSETLYTLTMPTGDDAKLWVRPANPYGEQIYSMDLVDGDTSNVETGRPGENPEDVDPATEDVYLDVSNLKEGGHGNELYNIAATFAHNTGRIFIGDPSGLSDSAMRRRLENMISTALKFGTTDHIAPHPRQVKGDAKIGVPPLKWVYGDSLGNIRRMIDISLKAEETGDLPKYVYDPATGNLSPAETGGRPLAAKPGPAGGGVSDVSGAPAQRGRTGARAAIFRALLREAGSGAQGDARGRDGLLARLVSVGNQFPGAVKGIFYARGPAGVGQPGVTTPARQGRVATNWRDSTGRLVLAPGKALYDLIGKAADPLLVRLQLKAASPELRRQLRNMKLEVQQAQDVAVAVARETQKLSEAERLMVSDIVEREVAAGTVPPAHAVRLAAVMNDHMGRQTDELIKLGMLSRETADRWRGQYLPRFYETKLRTQMTDAWADAVLGLGRRPDTLRGIKGKHLKGRGINEPVPAGEVEQWESLGWEVRDPDYPPGTKAADIARMAKNGQILSTEPINLWRDYTRQERDDMGEIRDAGFRFVMGYMQTQKDIALGRMFEAMAADPESSSRLPREGWVHVPDVTIEGTGAKRYGRLSGRYVPRETLSHLTQLEEAQSSAWRMYRTAMGIWKEGKTALNPVAHVNNVVSNMTMAHFAGIGYHRWDKYLGAIKDLANGATLVKEARDAGLFLGTISDAELMNTLPPELQELARKTDSKTVVGARAVYNAMTFWLRKPMGAAYQAEDTFFRYLIYRDARQRNATPEEAVEYAQRYIFTYDDLPKGARMIRDFGMPFFAYTYKAIPALLNTALTRPDRFMAPAAVLWTANMAAYAIAAGDDDESWDEKLRKYLNDPEYRAKVREQEQLEREFLPPWMKGTTALMTPKTIRLGTDELTKLPLFLDTARIIPGGDLFDVTPNAGGIPLPQPITPSHPLITMTVGMLANKDLFLGKELVDANDDRGEAAAKRTAWIWKQMSPAIAVNNYHWERGMNALAQASGGEVKWMPDVLGGDATGIDRSGNPVQPKYAVMQTFGVKMRPIDLETAEFMDQTQRQKMVRDIDAEMRKLMRLNALGAIPDRTLDKAYEKAQVKKERLMEGLTVDGDSR